MKNVSVENIGQIDFANTIQCPIIIARSPSGEAQLYLPQVTPRVPMSVYAKFHAYRMDGWMDGSIFMYRRYPANSCSFRRSMFWPHPGGSATSMALQPLFPGKSILTSLVLVHAGYLFCNWHSLNTNYYGPSFGPKLLSGEGFLGLYIGYELIPLIQQAKAISFIHSMSPVFNSTCVRN